VQQGDLASYEDAKRFLIAYNHSLLQFQMRHRTYGNLMDPQCPDLLLHVEGYDNAYMTHKRDMFLNCVALAKFIITVDVDVPCRCFVFAEVLRRYVADTKRLYHVMNQMQHIEMIVTRNISLMTIDEVRRSFEVGSHFIRLTDQLNVFYEKLRQLPDDGLFEKNLIPDHLQQFPQKVLELCDEYLAKYEELETIPVTQLGEVLATYDQMQLVGNHNTAALPSSTRPVAGFGAVVDRVQKSFDTAASFDCEDSRGQWQQQQQQRPFVGWDCLPDSATITPSDDVILNPNRVIDASMFDILDDTAQLSVVDAACSQCDGNCDDRVPTSERAGQTSLSTNNHHQQCIPFRSSSEQRFDVLDQILGKGGFGVVYKAWDHQDGRHVACKEVSLAAQNKTGIHELYKEYRVLATLEHAHIVKVLGFVVHEGHGRIFMEWVPSGSVQSVLQETKKGLREPIVRRYIREALLGLAYLHSRGIVHRDVKPGNMLLNGDGSVKLTDFGTSRMVQHAAETVQTGTMVGTVPYLAPECVRGTYSAASDIWAIGCTALHMITGRVPWADEAYDNVGLIFHLGNAAGLPIAVLQHPMSDALRELIAAAMTLDRHRRPEASALLRHECLSELCDG
jgi:hypothetical protein